MATPSSHMWYVSAAGGVWGPYEEARVAAFVSEGRVSADTLVSPWAQGPFAPAADSAEFTPLFKALATRPASPHPLTRRVAPTAALMPDRPAPARVAAQAIAIASVATLRDPEPVAVRSDAALRPLLVWAQLSAQTSAAFQAALTSVGPGVAIRPGLWLVQARTGAAALRNRLSRHLGATDALLVVEATADQAAWFNLDPERDRELRRLWNGS